MSDVKHCPFMDGACLGWRCALWCRAGPDLEAAIGIPPPKGVPKADAVCSILGLANAAVGRAYGEVMGAMGFTDEDVRKPTEDFLALVRKRMGFPPKEDDA